VAGALTAAPRPAGSLPTFRPRADYYQTSRRHSLPGEAPKIDLAGLLKKSFVGER
jgi:hypothetical protein